MERPFAGVAVNLSRYPQTVTGRTARLPLSGFPADIGTVSRFRNIIGLAMSTKPTVCIIESLGFLEEQVHKEGEIISRTLQLSRKPSAYAYVRTKQELRAVIKEFGDSRHRYLHLSCHGLVDSNDNPVGFHLTTGNIGSDKLARLLAPHVDGRRVFLSACLAAKSTFAKTLLEESKCLSVLAPLNEIAFDDAAVFWTSFYHLMFKSARRSMSAAHIKANVRICASLVQEQFRLFQRQKDGSIKETTISPVKRRK